MDVCQTVQTPQKSDTHIKSHPVEETPTSASAETVSQPAKRIDQRHRHFLTREQYTSQNRICHALHMFIRRGSPSPHEAARRYLTLYRQAVSRQKAEILLTTLLYTREVTSHFRDSIFSLLLVFPGKGRLDRHLDKFMLQQGLLLFLEENTELLRASRVEEVRKETTHRLLELPQTARARARTDAAIIVTAIQQVCLYTGDKRNA